MSNKTYILTRNGWEYLDQFGNNWHAYHVPDEVSDLAAETGCREITWDGRNAIPLDEPDEVVVVRRAKVQRRVPMPKRVHRVVTPAPSGTGTAVAVGMAGLLAGLGIAALVGDDEDEEE